MIVAVKVVDTHQLLKTLIRIRRNIKRSNEDDDGSDKNKGKGYYLIIRKLQKMRKRGMLWMRKRVGIRTVMVNIQLW